VSKVKLYKPDRLILHAEAADYYRANPEATTHQIAQLFALTTIEARDVVRSVVTQHAVNAATMQDAIAWAIANNAGFLKISERFHMSEGNSRRVALVAKEANKQKAEAAKANLDAAVAFANANPLITAVAVAKQFGVSVHTIERLRRKFRYQQEVDQQLQPKRERSRFRQITDADLDWDGSRVLDDVVRFPSRLGFAVFREVR
jgi:hypothetical protein